MEIIRCSFDFKLNNAPFRIMVNGEQPNLVHTDEFRPVSRKKTDLMTITYKLEAPEFADDVQKMLYLFEKKYRPEQNILFEVLIEVCLKHIQVFNRIILADLETYIDEILIILKHFELSKGAELSLLDGNHIWEGLHDNALIILRGNIWYPSPLNHNQLVKL